MRRPPRGAIPAACVVILALAGAGVRLPLFVERPVEPLELAESLDVDGRAAGDRDGAYLVALVGRRRATPLSAVGALLREGRRLRSPDVVPAGLDDAAYRQRQRRKFNRSVDQAGAAALAALGRPVARRAGGVTVVDVVGGSPADGRLHVDDVILAVDGQPTTTPAGLRERVAAADGRVRVTVERGGDERTVGLHPAPVDTGGQRRVGLGVVTRVASPRMALPVDVSVDGRGATGPSGGLMIALGVLDLLDGDRPLAAGRRVAGTGRIGPDGRVMPVSAVRTKVRGAVRADADVFLAPHSQQARAQRVAGDALDVIGVRTLEDAAGALDQGGW